MSVIKRLALILLLALFSTSVLYAQDDEIEPLLVSPAAGPIGTSHDVVGTELQPDTSYFLDVVFDESGESVFSTNLTADENGTVAISLFSEPSDELGEYTITLYLDDEPIREGKLTITEGDRIITNITGDLEYGVPISTELTATIPADVYSFEAEEGDVITISMESDDFDTFLTLQDVNGEIIAQNDNGTDGQNALILNYTIPETNTYFITATSRQSAESNGVNRVQGDYIVVLTKARFADGGVIESGETVVGFLTPDVQEASYTFTVEAGDVVTIDLGSSDFDPRLEVLNPEGTPVALDDDGGPGLFASIASFPIQDTGEYTILVDGYRGVTGERVLEGQYELSFRIAGDDVVSAPESDETYSPEEDEDAVTEEDTPTDETSDTEAPTVSSDGTIAYGDTITGELTEDNQVVSYTFEGQAGDVVDIALTALDFDTLLRLEDANGVELTRDDDGGDGLNSLISGFELPGDGTYTIYIDGYRGANGDRVLLGEYTLSLQMANVAQDAGGSDENTPDVATPEDELTINYNATLTGEITTDISNVTYRFDGAEGDTISIAVDSDAFDPLVRLLDADGNEVAFDDDSGGNFNALIEMFTLDADGDYQIVIEGYRGSDGTEPVEGQFEISLTLESTAESADETGTTDSDIPLIDYEQGTVTGTYPEDERYIFNGELGDIVDIALEADGFDPLVRLLDPNGNEVAVDDDSGGEFNALITGFELSQAGEYTIVIDSFSLSEDIAGEFSLTLSVSEELPSAPDETETTTPDEEDEPETTETPDDTEATDETETDSDRVEPRLVPSEVSHELSYGDTIDDAFTGEETEGIAFTFEGSAGDVIALAVDSTNHIDTVMTLFAPDGEVVASDDDGGAGFDPELRHIELPADGEYIVVVTPYTPNDRGIFSLSLQLVSPMSIEDNNFSLRENSAIVRINDKTPLQVLTYEASEGEELRLIVRNISAIVDEPIISIEQNGDLVAMNRVGMNMQMSFSFVVPADGDIQIVIESGDTDGVGVFEVSIESIPAR